MKTKKPTKKDSAPAEPSEAGSVQRLVSPALLSKAKGFIARDGLKLRRGWKTVINTTTGTLKGLPVIEIRKPPSTKYTVLALGELWHYETEKERDAVYAELQG